MCQSHTGRLTGLWFLPKPAFGLNTNDDDIYIYSLGAKGLIKYSPIPNLDSSFCLYHRIQTKYETHHDVCEVSSGDKMATASNSPVDISVTFYLNYPVRVQGLTLGYCDLPLYFFLSGCYIWHIRETLTGMHFDIVNVWEATPCWRKQT